MTSRICVAIDCEMDVTPKASPMSCHNDLPKSARCAHADSTITIVFLGKLRITIHIHILHKDDVRCHNMMF